jgi:hypothetical protein
VEKDLKIAWAAGVIEGEGSLLSKGYSPIVQIAMTDLDVLRRVQDIFGGHIYKIKKRESHWKDAWVWKIQGETALNCIGSIYGFLGNRRKSKADDVLDKYLEGVKIKESRSEEVAEKRREMIRLRKEDGLTHKQISDIIGCDRTYVSHVLSGKFDMV